MLAPFLFMATVRRSPCKVNLLLNVLGKRPDGFHELETILHPIPVFDELSFTKGGAGINLTCSEQSLPVDHRNLVYRAAALFLEAAGIPEGVHIHLQKNIPLAAGLGGGSGNAAVTLSAMNELFGTALPPQRLEELGSQLGSDVPFFLQNTPALGTGRGERVQPLGWFPALADAWVLLIHPGFGISTPWAYQNLARFPDALNGDPGRSTRLLARLGAAELNQVGPELYNSLEAPVLEKYPILRLYQDFLLEQGADAALMSGSGSTTFALVSSQTVAERILEHFGSRFGDQIWTASAKLGPTA